MSDWRTMTRYLVNDKWEEAVELQLEINDQAPWIINATEKRMLRYIHKMITDRRAAHGFASGPRVDVIMNILQTPFELADLPDELHPLFQTRVLFYSFVMGYMHNGMLVHYCETALRMFPDPGAPPERKYSYIVREIMYLALLRLDKHARGHLAETCLDQYAGVVATVMNAHPDLATDSLRPLPVDAHERLYVDNSLEAIGVPTPSLGAAWRMSEAVRCEDVIREWGEEVGMCTELDRTRRNQLSRMLNLAPVDLAVESVRSNVPVYLSGYMDDIQDVLASMITCIGHFLSHRENIIYDVLASYRVINLCNPSVTTTTAAGLCVHMTFFTHTHMWMCIDGLISDLTRELLIGFGSRIDDGPVGKVERTIPFAGAGAAAGAAEAAGTTRSRVRSHVSAARPNSTEEQTERSHQRRRIDDDDDDHDHV